MLHYKLQIGCLIIVLYICYIYYKNKFDSINSEIIKRDSIIKQLKKNIKHDTQQAYKDSYNDAVNKFLELTSPNKNE